MAGVYIFKVLSGLARHRLSWGIRDGELLIFHRYVTESSDSSETIVFGVCFAIIIHVSVDMEFPSASLKITYILFQLHF